LITVGSYKLPPAPAAIGGAGVIQYPDGDADMLIVNDPTFEVTLKGMGMERQDIQDPFYAIFWHEIGHAYYDGGVVKRNDQACKAVDLENMVRTLNQLDLRNHIYSNHF
jgi:hypothetical protein